MLVGQRAIPRQPAGADQQDVADLDADPLFAECGNDVVGFDGIGLIGDERPTFAFTVEPHVDENRTADDAAPRPVMHTVIGVSDVVVVAVREVAHVTKSVPLRRALRVEGIDLVVVARARVVHDMMDATAAEQGRIG